MNKLEFHEFMQAQVYEILIYKWIESEKLGYDIGQKRAGIEWIQKYAGTFRIIWENKKQEHYK